MYSELIYVELNKESQLKCVNKMTEKVKKRGLVNLKDEAIMYMN